jgi:N-acetylneuraminate synthase/sialic acid synthase
MSDMRTMRVGGRVLDDTSDCFVIAEVGHNHQGDLDTAHRLLEAAAQAGADAVKLQKRDNRELFTGAFFDSPYVGPNSFGETYGAHREHLELDRAQYAELQAHAAELGILFFATAFDVPSAEFLADLDMPAYKIASGDLRNLPLIEHVARIGRPMFISTGGGQMDAVVRAHDTAREHNDDVCIMQCTAGYPPAWEELNLSVISTYRERFPSTVIGFSSHDNGIAMATAGYALGARAVEKHFTLDRTMRGTDHAFSLEPAGLRKLVRDLRRVRVAMGDGVKRAFASEEAPITKMSKQLVAARDLPSGHVLANDDVAARSPGGGLTPDRTGEVLGGTLAVPLAMDEAISLDALS